MAFWGHCSNFQVSYEYDYDSRLLHSNLAFPLLKKLTNFGDPLANKVFKEEISKRLSSGMSSTIIFLYEEDYINIRNREDFWNIFGIDGAVLYEIEKKISKYKLVEGKKIYRKNLYEFEYFKLYDNISLEFGSMLFTFEKGKITGIGISIIKKK